MLYLIKWSFGHFVSGVESIWDKEVKGLRGNYHLGSDHRTMGNPLSHHPVPLAFPFLQGLVKYRAGMREDFAVQGYLLLNFIVTRSITHCYLDHHGNSFVTLTIAS